MAADGPSDSQQRGDVGKIVALFAALTALGTLLLVSQGAQSLPRAAVTALVLAIPFALYAWYLGWGA